MQKGGKLILPITPKFHVLGGNYTITKTGSTTSYSSITLANTLNSKKKKLQHYRTHSHVKNHQHCRFVLCSLHVFPETATHFFKNQLINQYYQVLPYILTRKFNRANFESNNHQRQNHNDQHKTGLQSNACGAKPLISKGK